ncbi:MAG: hypothetical protein K6F46_01965 [Desulfovibrio sp.]|nr:hypothetical protein [Desulfovibrio sp.]
MVAREAPPPSVYESTSVRDHLYNCYDSTDSIQDAKLDLKKYGCYFSTQEKESFAFLIDNFDTLITEEEIKSIQAENEIDPVKKEEAKKVLKKLFIILSKEKKWEKAEYEALKKKELKLIKKLRLMKLAAKIKGIPIS